MTKITSLQVNISSLSSQLSKRHNPYFKLVAQDLTFGGMFTFVLMKDNQTTQDCLNSMFKCNVSQQKLYEALLKPTNVITLSARFLRNPYELTFEVDNDKIPPVFTLKSIKEVEVKAEKLLKKAFTLTRKE